MELKRGEVYILLIELPPQAAGTNEDNYRRKLFVVLQDPSKVGSNRDVAGVLANTKNPPTRAVKPWEVEVGVPEGFDHETVIDCRFPFTIGQTDVEGCEFKTQLTPKVMGEVDLALAAGLGMI